MKKKISILLAIAIVTLSSIFASGGSEVKTFQIGVPDDASNQARALRLLAVAGLIEVDPAAGYSPELKDVTKYLYNIEITPTKANTLVSTLDDFAAATINGTYATPAGLVPTRDAILIETQKEGEDNPYVNVIVARSEDKDNPVYKKIVDAYQTQYIAEYILEKYSEAYFPAFEYDRTTRHYPNVIEESDNYVSSKSGKTVVRLGVCGGSGSDYWSAVQKLLDEEGANIYIEKVEFDAYNLPNEALNTGDIDINSFQHKAYLNKEIESEGYDIVPIGDTVIAPLSLYTRKASSLEELKNNVLTRIN